MGLLCYLVICVHKSLNQHTSDQSFSHRVYWGYFSVSDLMISVYIIVSTTGFLMPRGWSKKCFCKRANLILNCKLSPYILNSLNSQSHCVNISKSNSESCKATTETLVHMTTKNNLEKQWCSACDLSGLWCLCSFCDVAILWHNKKSVT